MGAPLAGLPSTAGLTPSQFVTFPVGSDISRISAPAALVFNNVVPCLRQAGPTRSIPLESDTGWRGPITVDALCEAG